MDVKEFQKKLVSLMALAIENQKRIAWGQVEEFFQEDSLDEDQLQMICQYLKSQGVMVEGIEEGQKEDLQELREQADPLSGEEEEYYREYMESLIFPEEKAEERDVLWSRASQKDPSAIQRLTELYLPKVAELCKAKHQKNLFIGDMIQEVNIRLLSALGNGECLNESDVFQVIREGIDTALKNKDQENFQDDCLVAKVRSLESAVKELTEDDEEEGKKFSIEELSIILDMDVEEIRDVLRLTGDDQ